MDDLQHWQSKDTFPYLWIYCPIMEGEIDSFGVKRKIYEELKQIEKFIKSTPLLGWIANTELKNSHIMKFFGKLNAVPFEIDVKNEKIWFYKNLRR